MKDKQKRRNLLSITLSGISKTEYFGDRLLFKLNLTSPKTCHAKNVTQVSRFSAGAKMKFIYMYGGRTKAPSTFIRGLSLLVAHMGAQGVTTPQYTFVIRGT